jgi:hypothetical protein
VTAHRAPATRTDDTARPAFPLVPGLRHTVPGQFPWETDGDGLATLAEDARAVVLPYSLAGHAPLLVDAGLSADAHDAYVVDLTDPEDAYDAAYGYTEGLDAYGGW